MKYIYVDSAGVVSDLDPATTSPIEAARRGLRRVPYVPPANAAQLEQNALIDAAIEYKEKQTLFPRQARELLLKIGASSGLANDPAYKKLKATDDEIAALRGKKK